MNQVMQSNSCLRCSNGSCTPRFTSHFDWKGKPWNRNYPHYKKVVESLLIFFPIKSLACKNCQFQTGLSLWLHGNSILNLKKKLMKIFPYPVGGCTEIDIFPPARQSAFHSQKEGFVGIVLNNFLWSSFKMVTHHEHWIRTEQAIKNFHVFKWNLSSQLIGQFFVVARVNVFVQAVTSDFNLFDEQRQQNIITMFSVQSMPVDLNATVR